MTPKKKAVEAAAPNGAYQSLVGGVAGVIENARRTAARSVNAAMTAAHWLIGRHIVEFEQGGRERAGYGSALLQRLATDLTQQFGRGFSRPNLQQMLFVDASEDSLCYRCPLSRLLAGMAGVTSRYGIPRGIFGIGRSVKAISRRQGDASQRGQFRDRYS